MDSERAQVTIFDMIYRLRARVDRLDAMHHRKRTRPVGVDQEREEDHAMCKQNESWAKELPDALTRFGKEVARAGKEHTSYEWDTCVLKGALLDAVCDLYDSCWRANTGKYPTVQKCAVRVGILAGQFAHACHDI